MEGLVKQNIGLVKIYGRIGEAKHKTGEASVRILKRMNS